MRSAQPRNQQQTSSQSENRRSGSEFRAKPMPSINAGAIVRRLLYWFVVLVTLPIRVVEWLSKPPGSAILFGLGAVWMILLSIESYAQGGGLAVAFLPKFGIDDGASIGNLPIALNTAIFYLSVVVSLIVTSIQAWLLRDINPSIARQQYEEVAHHRAPEKDDRAINLVERRRRRYISSGTRTDTIKGVVLILTYTIDFVVSYSNYPLLGLSIGRMLVNAVYFLFSLGGSEAMICLFRDAIDEARFAPKTEVV